MCERTCARISCSAWNGPILSFADLAWNARSCKLPHHVICRLTVKWHPILSNAAFSHMIDDADREICRILPFAASSDLQIDREMPINRETPNPLKRRILWFGVSEHGALQRMERFKGWSVAWSVRGWSVSKDRAFLGWLAITVDLQFRGCGIKNNSRLIYSIGMQNTATSRIKQVDN